MEESAPKRQRVSRDPDTPPAPDPQPNTAVDNPPSPSQSQSQSQTSARRLLFAPPVRTSLARPIPQILQQQQQQQQQQQRAAAPSVSNSNINTASTRPAVGPERGQRQPSPAGAVPVPVPDDGAATRNASSRPGDTPRPVEASPDSEASAQSGPGSPPRRTPVRPNPRPLPPPAPEGDDELNIFLSRTQRILPNTGVLIPPPPPPEPELPPVVSDPVSSTPPRGIHSSPRWRDGYKRKKKKKTKSKNFSPMKSSPLKPRSHSPSRTPRARGPSPSHSPYSRARSVARPLQDLGLNANTSAARQVPAFNKNARKIKERDRLRREIAVLRKEMDMAARENERIRAMQRAGRIVTPANEEDVLNLVQKTLVATGTAPSPGLAHQMAQAALKPVGILPFGPSKLLPQRQGDVDGDDEKEIRSHHPVQMSAQDELPFLQLFTPFSATSQVSVLPAIPNQPIRQRRQITLRSRDVPGLFTARVDMVVNAMNLNILALKVPALEPLARPELGPFVDKLCSGDCNRSMHYNIGIISWAMGEWYRLATQRARFWSQLEQGLADKGDYLRSVAQMREAPDERGETDVDDAAQDEALDRCDKADLLRFMGQRCYEILIPTSSDDGGSEAAASLRLEWNICFDWTGEAQSKMSLFVGVPGKWREADQRGVFAKVPKLFDDLIQEGQHPRKAVRTMVALLAGV
ncbi:hypothetical protein E4U42_008025 [Claviceps africana]|uniref:Uncharacterized protein n=1 Tax=Claviceps africana TaxID=83212 RepID=A0A8K0NFT1_9HYPO|nr:hypothetical protein E4U42_008025 [Claviceps africana]